MNRFCTIGKKTRPYKAAVIGIAAIFLFIGQYHLLYGQALLSGKIIDGETDELVDFALVMISDLKLYQYSDKDGLFMFHALPIGQYHVTISRIGFKNAAYLLKISKEDTIVNVDWKLFSNPIASETVIVSGQRITESSNRIGEASYIMSDEKMRQSLGTSIAQTVDGEPGMAQRSMGPAPARPVLRGLGGDRLLILEDGERTGDLSATSNDHAVVVDPISAKNITVYRGPEALQFGLNTLAGVINVENRNVPTSKPGKVTGTVSTVGESVNRGLALGSSILVPFKNLAIQTGGSFRKANNIKTPIGVLDNSNLDNYRWFAGLSRITEKGFLGIAFSQYESEYGIPGGFVGAHPNGVNITIQRSHLEAKGQYQPDLALIHHISYNASYTEYFHQEYESNGKLGIEFGVLTLGQSIQFHLDESPVWGSTTVGFWNEYRDYANAGFTFTPATIETESAGYIYNKKDLDRLTIKSAVRFDFKKIDIDSSYISKKTGFIRDRRFNGMSAAIEIIYPVTNQIKTGVRMMRNFKAPGLEELYSEGPHLAAYSYEVGNADLGIEKGLGLDLFSSWQSENIHIELTLYRNEIRGYIFPKNSGKINLNTTLPEYQFSGLNALFYGFEGHTEIELPFSFALNATASYVLGEFKNGNPIPFMPPFSTKWIVKYTHKNISLSAYSRITATQRRTGEFEEPTKGYLLTGLSGDYHISKFGGLHVLTMTANNLFNTEYRNHLSRVKSIMPEPGFNIRLVYKFFF